MLIWLKDFALNRLSLRGLPLVPPSFKRYNARSWECMAEGLIHACHAKFRIAEGIQERQVSFSGDGYLVRVCDDLAGACRFSSRPAKKCMPWHWLCGNEFTNRPTIAILAQFKKDFALKLLSLQGLPSVAPSFKRYSARSWEWQRV